MKTLTKLQTLLDYYMYTRQVGHSTLIKKGFENFDREKLLLTYNSNGHPNIPTKKDEIISWNNLDKLRGCKKPLIIDNAVIYCILNDAIQRITELEEENKQLKIRNIDVLRTSNEELSSMIGDTLKERIQFSRDTTEHPGSVGWDCTFVILNNQITIMETLLNIQDKLNTLDRDLSRVKKERPLIGPG